MLFDPNSKTVRTSIVTRSIPLIATLLAFSGSAHANSLSLGTPLELQFQAVAIEPTVSADVGHGISFNTTFVVEPGLEGDATAFSPEEFLMRFDGDSVAIWAGKFNPQFGAAWDQDVGVFDASASAYELTERFGVGGSLTLGTGLLSNTQLVANAFGATGGISYTMALDTQATPGLTLRSGVLSEKGQKGVLLGVSGDITVAEKSLSPLLEVAQLEDSLIISSGLSVVHNGLRCSLLHSNIILPAQTETQTQLTATWSL
jgi:hypothetical protein